MVLGKKHGTGYLPYTCVKSHLNDKPTCCLPLRPQSRHSNLWYFGAQLLSLQPCCLRLAHYIAVIHSRLASNAVVSSLFDRFHLSDCTPFAGRTVWHQCGRAYTSFLRYPFKNLGFMRFPEPVFAGIYQNILTTAIFRAC